VRAREPEMLPQGRAGVFRPEHSAFLQFGNDTVDEVVESVRGQVGYEDVTVGGIFLYVRLIVSATWPGVPMNADLVVTSMINPRMFNPFASAISRHLAATASG
jgi:hypothetical protein